jgi:uncharacterized protein YggE
MKRLLCAAALALPVLSGCGEKEEQPYFQVTGRSMIEKKAEVFVIGARISERDKDRLESLRAAAGKVDQVRAQLRELEGLEKVTLKAGKAETKTIRPRACDPGRDYDRREYPENCDPVDFITSITLVAEGEPGEAAGNALSLLTELGLEEVELGLYDVRDRVAAEKEARQTALRNAAEAARALAEPAGATIGKPLEIRYDDRNSVAERYTPPDEDTIVVTGSRIPAVKITLPSSTVTFESEVSVKFALEKPGMEK